jgi:hypothetical protein
MNELNIMKILYFLVFSLLSIFLRGQTITISEQIQLRNDLSYEIIGQFKDRTLLFRNKGTSFEVEAFNDQLKKIWNRTIELEKRQTQVLSIHSTPNDFVVLYHFKNKAGSVLRADRFDPTATLTDTATIKFFPNLFFSLDLQVVQSLNKKIFLFYTIERQSEFRFFAYNIETNEILWEQIITPRDFAANRDFYQPIIDNSGQLYFIIGKDNFRSRKENHHYEILQYSWTTNQLIRTAVPMLGLMSYAIVFRIDEVNQKLGGAGFFSDSSPGKSQGYFFLNIPLNAPENYTSHFAAFTPEFKFNLVGTDEGIFDVVLADLVYRQDGGAILIGERRKEVERRISSPGRFGVNNFNRFIIDYYLEDLFLFSINPDGSPHWEGIFPKKQYSQDDGAIYSSYFLYKSPSKLRLLFNDDIKFENTVSEYVINGYGDFDRNSILSTEKLNLRLRFKDAVQLSGDRIIVPSERRNELKLVRMNY